MGYVMSVRVRVSFRVRARVKVRVAVVLGLGLGSQYPDPWSMVPGPMHSCLTQPLSLIRL